MGIECSANAGVEKYEGGGVVGVVVVPGRTAGDLAVGCWGFWIDAMMLSTCFGATMYASRRIYDSD